MWFSQVPSTINLWYCRRKILSTLGKPSSSVQCIWTPPNILVRICLKGGLAHEIWRTKRASHDPKDIWRLILSWEGIDESGFSLRDRWLLLLLLLICFSCVRLCATPKMAAHQASPSLGFSRQEHWSGLPFPSPMQENEKWKWSRSVVSDSLPPHGMQPTRLLCPWDFARQEYWSGLPLPSPSDFSRCPLLGESYSICPLVAALFHIV